MRGPRSHAEARNIVVRKAVKRAIELLRSRNGFCPGFALTQDAVEELRFVLSKLRVTTSEDKLVGIGRVLREYAHHSGPTPDADRKALSAIAKIVRGRRRGR